MTRDGDNETPLALVVTADQMRTAVERLHGVYLARAVYPTGRRFARWAARCSHE